MAVNSNDKPINGLLHEPGFYVRAKVFEVLLSGMSTLKCGPFMKINAGTV
jgi:hypothetical protein